MHVCNDFHLSLLWVRSLEIAAGLLTHAATTEMPAGYRGLDQDADHNELFVRYRSPIKA